MMKRVDFVVEEHESNTIDWCSRDFDSMPDAIDDLNARLDGDPHLPRLTLMFQRPLAFDSSLPRVWRQVIVCLQRADFTGALVVCVPSVNMASHFERYLPVSLRVMRHYHINTTRLTITVGDISHAVADALVNASNRRLELGGGVSHALKLRFGEGLQHQMWAKRKSVEDGGAVLTTHNEPAGPTCIYHVASAKGDMPTINASLKTVLELAHQRQDLHVISPALGTGTGGLPMRDFAHALFEQVQRSPYAGHLQLWCWTRSDFNDVCAILDSNIGSC